MIHLRIDDREIEIKEGRTVLQAAREHSIPIPTLCYHEALEPFAACRLCVVELETSNGPQLVAACAYPCQEGLIVHTNSELVRRSRRVTVELLMATSAHVPVIQGLAATLGVEKPRFVLPADPCILCGLCVRACHEIVGVGAISLINRGMEKRISPPFRIASSDCIGCGTCVLVCPTGAITLTDITGDSQTAHCWPSVFERQRCYLCGPQNLHPVFADIEDPSVDKREIDP